MRTTETFYAIELPCKLRPRQPRVAVSGTQAGPLLFYWHKKAVASKRALLAEGFKGARVVRVRATFAWK